MIDPEFRCGVCDACDEAAGNPCTVVVLYRERDEARAALAKAEEGCRIKDRALSAIIANARAAALEKAARCADAQQPVTYGSTQIAERIRALAPLPPTMVVVEREKLEHVQWTLGNGCFVAGEDNVRQSLAILDDVLGAL